jgi:exonuclease SbcD
LHVVQGPLADLCASRSHGHAEDGWVQAIVTDPVVAHDAVAQLRRRFPYLANLEHLPPRQAGLGRTSYAERTRGRTDRELFRDFWQHATGEPVSPELESAYLVVADRLAAASADLAGAGRVEAAA